MGDILLPGRQGHGKTKALPWRLHPRMEGRLTDRPGPGGATSGRPDPGEEHSCSAAHLQGGPELRQRMFSMSGRRWFGSGGRREMQCASPRHAGPVCVLGGLEDKHLATSCQGTISLPTASVHPLRPCPARLTLCNPCAGRPPRGPRPQCVREESI